MSVTGKTQREERTRHEREHVIEGDEHLKSRLSDCGTAAADANYAWGDVDVLLGGVAVPRSASPSAANDLRQA
jgi:hypothetical protein